MLERKIEIKAERRLNQIACRYRAGKLTLADARRATANVHRWAQRQTAMGGASEADLRAMEDEAVPLTDPVVLPVISTPPNSRDYNNEIITIDLYCCAADGVRPRLWKPAVKVIPVDAFECAACWIASGHYVIDYKGSAIVVHCANLSDRWISVQFMLGELVAYPAARSTIEPMLLAMVVGSAEQQASVFEQKQLSDIFKDKQPP